MNESPTTLVHLFQKLAVDQAAWSALCDHLRADLVQVARRLASDGDLAEDIAQEALIALRRAAQRVADRPDWTDEAVRRYAKAIAAHMAIRARKQARRLVPIEAHHIDQDHQLDPAASLMQAETTALIQACLAELREPFAEAVSLHHLGGLSQQEVAQHQGVSAGTARMRIWRGLRQMRSLLHKRGVQVSTLGLLSAFTNLRAEAALPTATTPITTLCSKGVFLMFSGTGLSAVTITLALVMSQNVPATAADAPTPEPTPPVTTNPDQQPAGIPLEETKENIIAERLVGSWVEDQALAQRFNRRVPADSYTFRSDPAVTSLVPDKYAQLIQQQNMQVFQSGYMSIIMRNSAYNELPYILTNVNGNPHLIFWLPRNGDTFGNGESFNLMLGKAEDSKNDILFIGGDFNEDSSMLALTRSTDAAEDF